MRKLLLLAPVLLASCHSEQVALRSHSAAAEPVAATAPTMPLDSALAATVVVPRPIVATNTGNQTNEPLLRKERPPRRVGRLPLLSTMAAVTSKVLVAKQLAHPLQRRRPTDGAAESGLGGIGLFFIGVVLAVLAGLGALVSLIPGVSFWGGLGLAAARLVVVFLLYSLLSGGKKKPAGK